MKKKNTNNATTTTDNLDLLLAEMTKLFLITAEDVTVLSPLLIKETICTKNDYLAVIWKN